MFGIFNRIKAAKNWVVCLELSSKKRYQDGLDLLEIVNKQGLYNIETLLLKIFFLTS